MVCLTFWMKTTSCLVKEVIVNVAKYVRCMANVKDTLHFRAQDDNRSKRPQPVDIFFPQMSDCVMADALEALLSVH